MTYIGGRSIEGHPVAAIVFEIAGFRFTTTQHTTNLKLTPRQPK